MVPSAAHPPGLYGPAASARALNLIQPATKLAGLPTLPAGVSRAAYQAEKSRPLKPELLTAALALLFLDILAVMALQMAGGGLRRAAKPAAALLVACALLMLHAASEPASAQSQPARSAPPATDAAKARPDDRLAMTATLKTRLAFVITGDPQVDRTSESGLRGLTEVLSQRTAFEPAEPIGVDVRRDELAFFPILYWPILRTDEKLPDAVLAKVDTYMKQGGLIVFDTRDFGEAMPSPTGVQGPGARALQRLLGTLDVPRLEPVPQGHVLTKAFYLLRGFPGRWDGGQLWVEATRERTEGRQARHADGVSALIVTPNDMAAAWARDRSGRGLYPMVPGGELQREMAYRAGINIVMYALTGNYKADQVHVPALLERLGQ
jgi:hypothetical protein